MEVQLMRPEGMQWFSGVQKPAFEGLTLAFANSWSSTTNFIVGMFRTMLSSVYTMETDLR